ncbi:MAG: DNA polymerase [Cetobacterium sp.]
MVPLNSSNTTGKIANFLETYKDLDFSWGGYTDYIEWFKDFRDRYDSPSTVMSFDIETRKLYPIDNKLTMFAFTWKNNGVYYTRAFNTRDWSDSTIIKVLKSINLLKSKKVLHNAYFDITTLAIMFGVKIKWDYDTHIIYHNALLHRAKDDADNDFGMSKVGLSLKDLTRDFLSYGDYEEEINTFKKEYCKEHKIKAKEFTYDLIPNDVLAPYCCMDTTCTLQLYEKSLLVIKAFENNGYIKLRNIIKMKHEVSDIYMDARIRGMAIDRSKVMQLHHDFSKVMEDSKANIYKDLREHINYVERELYFRTLEKDFMMKDFQYIAEGLPKLSKSGKETWVSKKANITDSRGYKIKEESKLNLNSSQHKAMLFVESMGLQPLEISKKTKSPKCDIKFMEHHAQTHKELQSFIDFGKSRTALNNFLGVNKVDEQDPSDDLTQSEIGKGDSKTLWELTSDTHPYAHPSYNINGTVTGRCSCTSPNLQQIPSRGVLKDIKKCFVAREGHYLLYSDYASAEVVLLGAMINSDVIGRSLKNGWDLHSMNVWGMMRDKVLKVHPTWGELFDSCEDDVDKLREFYKGIKNEFENTLRYQCKSLVFSLAYGTTAHGVSTSLGIPRKEAQELINSYLKANPSMHRYIQSQHSLAKSKGYTENPFGARLMLPDAPNMYSSDDKYVRMRGDKQLKKALNYPIQSSNGFLLYEGIIRANKIIKSMGYEGKIHLMFTVYDSFCYEIDDTVPKEVAIDIFERSFICYLGDFYLGIDIEIGDSWGSCVGVKRDRRKKGSVAEYNLCLWES